MRPNASCIENQADSYPATLKSRTRRVPAAGAPDLGGELVFLALRYT